MKSKIAILVFVCGFVLMALEMAAGRLLTFDYGGTYIVWGSILTVIMSGLGFGYYFGGHLADKSPNDKVLYNVVFLSAVSILIIPFIYSGLVEMFSNGNQTYVPLLISFFLFLLPSILLGAVAPMAVKISVKEIDHVGREAGNLYALATIGNVLGVFISTFVLIMFLPLNNIFILLGVILLVTVLLLNKKGLLIIIVLIAAIALASSAINFNTKIVDEGRIVTVESIYGAVTVENFDGIKRFSIAGGTMSAINATDKFTKVPGEEYNYIMEDIIVRLNPSSTLMLGVGGGIIPMRLNELHGIPVDGVDINGVAMDVAQEYFGLTESATLKLYTEDARMYLRNSNKKYDVIAMDTFDYVNGFHVVPTHLSTKEYYQMAKDDLNVGGSLVVLLVNLEGDEFVKSQILTLEAVFDNVDVFTHDSIVVASDRKITFSSESLQYKRLKNTNGGTVYKDYFVPVRT